jgi:hypothetical protein
MVTDIHHANMVQILGTGARDFKFFGKCYLKVSEQVEIIHALTCYVYTYPCKFHENYDRM